MPQNVSQIFSRLILETTLEKPNFQWGMLIGICVQSISTKDQGVAHTLSWLSRDASFKTASKSEPL